MNNVKFLLCRNSRSLKQPAYNTINKGPKTEHFMKHHPNNEFKRAWSSRTTCRNAETIEPTAKWKSLTY
jgi:hypothetical protein